LLLATVTFEAKTEALDANATDVPELDALDANVAVFEAYTDAFEAQGILVFDAQ
jgi:hypothetical protein